jgi:two-component system phosphate regulon sensor histidine kinase PhoR
VLEQNFVRFYVADTGVGIPIDNQKNIFNLFYKVDRVGSKLYGGTGIGLAICAQLVSAMGGQISVDSSPGEGAKFDFTLPIK